LLFIYLYFLLLLVTRAVLDIDCIVLIYSISKYPHYFNRLFFFFFFRFSNFLTFLFVKFITTDY
ncbi:hypothetical protein CCUS01_03647, partial [Colletotrichum cuscutae]